MLYTVIEVHVYYRSEIGENDKLSTCIVFKDYYIHISVVIEGPLVYTIQYMHNGTTMTYSMQCILIIHCTRLQYTHTINYTCTGLCQCVVLGWTKPFNHRRNSFVYFTNGFSDYPPKLLPVVGLKLFAITAQHDSYKEKDHHENQH